MDVFFILRINIMSVGYGGYICFLQKTLWTSFVVDSPLIVGAGLGLRWNWYSLLQGKVDIITPNYFTFYIFRIKKLFSFDEVLLKRGSTSQTQFQVHLSLCLSTSIRACKERCTLYCSYFTIFFLEVCFLLFW